MKNDKTKNSCTALSPIKQTGNSRVCDFFYLAAVFESDLSDHAKYIFCKHFSERWFRHGWLTCFRRAMISDKEYRSLKELAAENFIELQDEGEFISIGRPIWAEVY